jgi:hypothetical protein
VAAPLASIESLERKQNCVIFIRRGPPSIRGFECPRAFADCGVCRSPNRFATVPARTSYRKLQNYR